MCCCSKPNEVVKDSVSGERVTASTQQTAIDPVCGMKVDPANAANVQHKGTTMYFCCRGCATKFRDEPDRYLRTEKEGLPCKC